MARWSAGKPYRSEATKAYQVWTGGLHYVKNNGATWFDKIEVYASTEAEAEELQTDLLSFLNAQELLGVTHG